MMREVLECISNIDTNLEVRKQKEMNRQTRQAEISTPKNMGTTEAVEVPFLEECLRHWVLRWQARERE